MAETVTVALAYRTGQVEGAMPVSGGEEMFA